MFLVQTNQVKILNSDLPNKMQAEKWVESGFRKGPGEKQKYIQHVIENWLNLHRTATVEEMMTLLATFKSFQGVDFESLLREPSIGGFESFNRWHLGDLEFILVRVMIVGDEVKATSDLVKMIDSIKKIKLDLSHINL